MTSKTGQLLETLTAGVAAAAKFHSYSANNQLLILLQAPQATRVAGFRRWQSLGRQVRKGEKGIAIMAPCLYRPTKTNPAGQEHNTSTASNSDGETTGPKSAGQLRGMRVAHVFDPRRPTGNRYPKSPRSHSPGRRRPRCGPRWPSRSARTATGSSAGSAGARTATPTRPAGWCGSGPTSSRRWPRGC